MEFEIDFILGKIPPHCKFVKLNKLCSSKSTMVEQALNRYSYHKREKMEDRGNSSKEIQNLSRQISLDIWLWFYALSYWPTRAVILPSGPIEAIGIPH
jgi:hypothetical protein